MSTHSHTTIRNPTGEWSPARSTDPGRRFVLAVTLLAGLFMTAAGVAALLMPSWVAHPRAVPPPAGFFMPAAGGGGLPSPPGSPAPPASPRHTHFVQDAGAFQLGLGTT